MKHIKFTIAVGGTLLGYPCACVAAEGERQSPSLPDVLYSLLPMLVVGALLYIVFLLVFRGIGKRSGNRYEEHYERVEAQLKRIADALEKRDKDGDHAG